MNPEEPGKQDWSAASDPFVGQREAGGVLAVLLLARLWPARFEGAWVPTQKFGEYSVKLPIAPDKNRTKLETLRRLVREGLETLRSYLPRGTIQRERVRGMDSRAPATRLRQEPTLLMIDWFRRFGLGYLRQHKVDEFSKDAARIVATIDHLVEVFEEATAQALIQLGQYEAAQQHLIALLGNEQNPERQESLTLHLSQAMLGLATANAAERALELLRPFVEAIAPKRAEHAELTRARILITYVAALQNRSVRRSAEGDSVDETIDAESVELELQLLEDARALLPNAAYADRAQLGLAEARALSRRRLLELAAPAISPSDGTSALAMGVALQSWQLAGCPMSRSSEWQLSLALLAAQFELGPRADDAQRRRLEAATTAFVRASTGTVTGRMPRGVFTTILTKKKRTAPK